MTSAAAASRRNSATLSGSFMSRATLRVVRLKIANIGEVSAPDGSWTTGSSGAHSRRRLSGRAGDSILTTSAPSSASAVPLSAPAIAVPNEMARMPLSGPGTGAGGGGSRRGRGGGGGGPPPLAGDLVRVALAQPRGGPAVLRQHPLVAPERLARQVELTQPGQLGADEEAPAARLHVVDEV